MGEFPERISGDLIPMQLVEKLRGSHSRREQTNQLHLIGNGKR